MSRALVLACVVALIAVLLGCGAGATSVPTPERGASVVSFTTEDGTEIKGRLFGQGDIGVVLAHMYPADQSSWWGFAQVLDSQGYMALAFDFRGYGDSGGAKEIELIDRDVEAAINYLKGRGASTVFLAGASMGGTASLKVAAKQGEDVAAVVSLSAPVEFRGISVEDEQVRVPVLLLATRGDVSATNSINVIIDDGIATGATEMVVYEGGRDHGTDILTGENAEAARDRILSFLEAHTP